MIDNRERHRFEEDVDGYVAFAEYDLDGDTITFTHTIVPSELEGRGVASALVKAALDDVRHRGLRVVPRCPFVAAWIARHPDYRDLLA
ncbi:GNAT family N-acetyltransferase [Sphingomonas sp.]|uniref:GNAT family N-acetyltransferase n=1 Tax=Sphingomonas sp. TaxID=28214 RepID=UPI002DD68A61|nr:GNAT family N-acetyltransferase [Sphingomonas sp.]